MGARTSRPSDLSFMSPGWCFNSDGLGPCRAISGGPQAGSWQLRSCDQPGLVSKRLTEAGFRGAMSGVDAGTKIASRVGGYVTLGALTLEGAFGLPCAF